MAHPIISLYLVNYCLQWICWIPSSILQTEIIFDVTGTLVHSLLALLSVGQLNKVNTRQLIQAILIIIWSLRLFWFLFQRSMKERDRRFEVVVTKPRLFLFVFTLQGTWAALNMFPSLLCITNPDQPPLGFRDYLGWTLWLSGLVIETIADQQKKTFRSNPANKKKFINIGLWSISRHPNYFGEILLWLGLFISASSTFTIFQYLSALAPALNTANMTLRASIPRMEEDGLKRWGASSQYQKYIRETPVLIPFCH